MDLPLIIGWLPLSQPSVRVVVKARFERAAFSMSRRRSDQLSYSTIAVLFEMVVRVGLAPTVFLMWQIYSLLRSLLSHLTV